MGRIHDGVEKGFLEYRPDLRLLLSVFLIDFDVTWGRSMRLYGSDVNAFILHPQKEMQETFGFDKEVLLIHSQYSVIQPRIFQIAQQIMSESPCMGRVEPLLFLLVSAARDAEEKVRTLVSDSSNHRVLVPFNDVECKSSAPAHFVKNRISKYLYDRDLFNMHRPLASDLYFFGRNPFVMELRDCIRRGENVGLFGLRRTGKTSILLRLQRLLEAEQAGRMIYIDLEDQDLYRLRWWELLERVAKQLPSGKKGAAFTESDAAARFRSLVESAKRSKQKIIVAFDEIEHVTPGENLRMREHWDKDFVEFWKTLRAIQNVNPHICFIVCGTNAAPIENSTYDQRDNPLYGMAVAHYIPPFNRDEVRQMVRTLGRFMGLAFDEDCFSYLRSRYGGHPFITRQACSSVFQENKGSERPLKITRKDLEEREGRRDLNLFQHAEHILGVLNKWYSQELAMLEYLSFGQEQNYIDIERDVPSLSAHLRSYGLVEKSPPELAYSFVGAFLRNRRATEAVGESLVERDNLITNKLTKGELDGNLSELSALRNSLEPRLRKFVKIIFMAQKGAARWIDPLLDGIPEERRRKLNGVAGNVILNEHLFLLDLLQIITKNWQFFKQLESQPAQSRITCTQFEVLLDFINRHREDAHAKDLPAADLASVRIAVQTIDAAIRPYLDD